MNTIVGERPRAPWHLWAVGVLTLLWNSIGGFSYTMTRLGKLADLGMGEAEIAFFASYSPIANAFWALGVWGAIACSLLILLRSRFAFHAIVAAIIGLIGSNYFQYTADVPESLQSAVLPILIWSTTVFLLFYTRSQSQTGVLR
ncbi:MAG: hypothetical protein AAFN04_10060 [Pseudomonadota bacterium]